jgi:glycosyltransferase involved in cell wall biosynthesis
MLVSLVIPCFNEERRLGPSLDVLLPFLSKQAFRSEVLVVDNGSHDRTLEVAHSYAARDPRVRVLAESRRGKGRAVRRGMLEALGEWRLLCDADFSMPVEEIPHFVPPCLSEAEIAIASREAPGALRVGEPARRHLMGRIFNFLIRAIVLPGFQDTQCGFKSFRSDAAEAIFRRQSIEGMCFDVEVLAVARALGYRITELPITWYFDADSRVRPVRDTVLMVRDLWRIRSRMRHADAGQTVATREV